MDAMDTIRHYIELNQDLSSDGQSELRGACEAVSEQLSSLRSELRELRELVDILCEKTGTSQY